jgi:general secretion pathway protein A
MYQAFFGLSAKPFAGPPDADFLFESRQNADALKLLESMAKGSPASAVIVGAAGCGKTTLIQRFRDRVGPAVTLGLMLNRSPIYGGLARWALPAFGRDPVGRNAMELNDALLGFLIAEYARGRRCLLVVDEAQSLPVEALEELQLLADLNGAGDPLLQILLVGQPALLEQLKIEKLERLAGRVEVISRLDALPAGDVGRYVRSRLARAGADRPIFAEEAIGAIAADSAGVPRLINALCELGLIYAFAEGSSCVDLGLIGRAIADRHANLAVRGIPVISGSRAVAGPTARLNEMDVLAAPPADTPDGIAAQPATTVGPPSETALRHDARGIVAPTETGSLAPANAMPLEHRNIEQDFSVFRAPETAVAVIVTGSPQAHPRPSLSVGKEPGAPLFGARERKPSLRRRFLPRD